MFEGQRVVNNGFAMPAFNPMETMDFAANKSKGKGNSQTLNQKSELPIDQVNATNYNSFHQTSKTPMKFGDREQ